MTNQEKYNAIINAYTIKVVEDDREEISIFKDNNPEYINKKLSDIHYSLDTTLDLAYDIAHTATIVLENLGLDKLASDDLDLYAEANSIANPYTGVQLSYLNPINEAEVSDLMKDEAITSIAQACGVWYDQKVVQACEALIAFILEE